MLATSRVYALKVALMASERGRKIGARMRERREELGLSQSAVADEFPGASVTKDYISRWELGKVTVSDDYLEQAAEALRTTVADLVAGPVAEREQATPDVLGALEGDVPAALARIEKKLDEALKRPALTAEQARDYLNELMWQAAQAAPEPDAEAPEATGHQQARAEGAGR